MHANVCKLTIIIENIDITLDCNKNLYVMFCLNLFEDKHTAHQVAMFPVYSPLQLDCVEKYATSSAQKLARY